jgi:hypothetical protein
MSAASACRLGFGFATSYYYPGGLNLERISDPPPVIVVK